MNGDNPFQSPAEPVEVETDDDSEFVRVASRIKRYLNFVIDVAICLVLANVALLAVVACGGSVLVQNVPGIWINCAAFMIYYIPQETLWGKTIGKFITRTTAVRVDGGSLTLGDAFGRTLCRVIPFEPFSYLIGGPFPVGWHDKWSNTRVIDDRPV